MRKLIFKLSDKRPTGLGFSLHTGSRMSLSPGQQLPYPIQDDDPLTSTELLAWYDSRYKSAGLTTRLLEDSVAAVKPEPVKVPAPDQEQESTKVDKLAEEPHVEETSTVETLTPEEPTSSQEDAEDSLPVEDWPFPKMRDFVSKHDIELNGRDKQAYIDGIKAFLEANEE